MDMDRMVTTDYCDVVSPYVGALKIIFNWPYGLWVECLLSAVHFTYFND